MKEFTGWQKFEVHIYDNHITKYLVPLKETAKELIALLKKEYHLK
jgi:hypothetical protein